MDIVKEQVDNLNAVVKIKVGPADYSNRVESTLKRYQKDARIPGFRPGKVPSGMIKKMYGKSILAEELNKLLNESIYKYLSDNNIEILGNPMPKADDNIDWENQSDFEFLYDLGLAPKVALSFSSKDKFDYYTVKIDEQLLDKYVSDIRRRYGKFSNPETAEDNDILYGAFAELNADGTEKEGGIATTTTVAIDLIKDAASKAKFVGLKKEESVTFNPAKAFGNASEVSAMLGITKEAAESLTSDFKFTVASVNRVEKAELNQDLFDRLFGAGTVNSEAEFTAKVKEDIAKVFSNDSDRKLQNDIVSKLIDSLNVQLPDTFLKRWLMAVNEKPLTDEQLEKEYPEYAKGLKWRLIENQVIKDNNIQITPDEAKAYVHDMIRNQFAQYGQANIDDETLNKLTATYLGKEEQARKVYESIAGKKAFDTLKSTFTLNNKELAYDEFVKTVNTL